MTSNQNINPDLGTDDEDTEGHGVTSNRVDGPTEDTEGHGIGARG